MSRLDELPDLCTPKESWAYLRVGRTKFYELVRSGAIEGVRFDRLIRVPRRELERIVRGERESQSLRVVK